MSEALKNVDTMRDIVDAVHADVEAVVQHILTECVPQTDDDESSQTMRFGDPIFEPFKKGGKNGRWCAVMVETFAGREFVHKQGSFADADKARAVCPELWPEVRISEGKRIERGVQDALAGFLGQVQRIVMHERQTTRAFDLVDTEQIDINEALKRVREADKAAVDNERDDGPKDAPKPVTAEDVDSVFE